MTNQSACLKLLTAFSLLACGMLAHADVTRCIDKNGKIAYTNGTCNADTRIMEVIMVERDSGNDFVYQPAPVARQYLRDSPWANVYIAPRKRQTDVESIRSARLKVISMESMPRTSQSRQTLNSWKDSWKVAQK